MGEASQNRMIATMHRLSERSLESFEADVASWSHERPIALIIPSLYSELDGPALDPMIDQLARVPYLDEIVVGLDQADDAQYARAREFFGRLPQRHHVLWHDGPRLQAIHRELDVAGLAPDAYGKGRNVWYCLGYVLARGRAQIVLTHDADIVTYDREMPARLVYPVAHPSAGFGFAKGYYFRTDGARLRGRVTRLLITPMITALRDIVGDHDFLDFVDSFHYPLAGEVAMRTDVADQLRVPSDWGVEIGMLAEIHRRVPADEICQVEIADAYDHKHQPVSADDPTKGLHKMSDDIAEAVYRDLAAEGTVLDAAALAELQSRYTACAKRLVDVYAADAEFNGFAFDRGDETAAIDVFAGALVRAGERFLTDAKATPFTPSWAEVRQRLPRLADDLLAAVAADEG